MAAPLSKDINDLTGTWNFNRKLSDDPDQVFALQGVPWLTRKVLRLANLSLRISQFSSLSDASNESSLDSSSDENSPVITLHVKQVVNPGSFNSESSCQVNGRDHPLTFPIFGDITMSLRYVRAADIDNDSIRQQYEEGGGTQMAIDEVAENVKMGWSARVFWGFEYINGKRYLTRNVKTWKGDNTVIARMVYDFQDK